jgi:hypothetical protein
MAPLTSAQISIDRWSKLLLIGCVILILVSGHALMGCGRRHHGRFGHHGPNGHPHPQPYGQDSDDAVAAIAIGEPHPSASISFSFSHSHEKPARPEGAVDEKEAKGERRGRRHGHHFGIRHGRRHQQQQEQEQQQVEGGAAAVNAGTFDIKIQPVRQAGPKMPEAPRAVAIPLELPQEGADAKPEPRPYHGRRRMPRRSFQQDKEQQQPEEEPGQMEQFPVIVDGLKKPAVDVMPVDQPMVDPIPIIDQPLVDPMPVDFVGNEAVEQPARGHDHHHRGFGGKKGRCCCAQRSLAGLGLATGMTGVVAAFRPSRCGVALFLVGVLVVEILTLLRVSTKVINNVSQCMDSARNVDEINACGDFGKRAGITATLIIGVVAASFATCGGRLGRGVVAREQEERVEAEADALRDAIVAGAAVPIVVGSCDLAPLPAYVLAVEGTACVDPAEQQGGVCSV